jgi:hypothetical protein
MILTNHQLTFPITWFAVSHYMCTCSCSSPVLSPLHNIQPRRVGQNHTFTVYVRYFLQGFHLIYCHIRRIYTILANPTHTCMHSRTQPLLLSPLTCTSRCMALTSTPPKVLWCWPCWYGCGAAREKKVRECVQVCKSAHQLCLVWGCKGTGGQRVCACM